MRTDFIFDGRAASDFCLAICSFSGTSEETHDISVTTFETFTPANLDRNLFVASTYDQPLSIELDVCKIIDCHYSPMTFEDVETIQRWFCRDDGYHEFTFISDDNELIKYNAKINITAKEIAEKIIGLTFKIDTDSSYGYVTRKIVKSMDTDTEFALIDYSSKEGNSYVDLDIECLESGNYEISYKFGDVSKTIRIKNCSAGETISINNMLVITTTDDTHDVSDDFNYVYPKMFNSVRDNKTIYTSNKKCNLTFNYRFKRKVGL